MHVVLIPKSKARTGKRQIWGSKNWQGRGEREEASTLLNAGLSAALSKAIQRTEVSVIPFLVFYKCIDPRARVLGEHIISLDSTKGTK